MKRYNMEIEKQVDIKDEGKNMSLPLENAHPAADSANFSPPHTYPTQPGTFSILSFLKHMRFPEQSES